MRLLLLVPPISLVILQGCAHAPITRGKDPQAVLRETCDVGNGILSTTGSVWLKAQSKDASGQFPAEVQATPDKLKLEVINLVGQRMAFISVESGKYRIEIPSKKTKIHEGVDTWGGIPLRWSAELFLGKVPCPPAGARVELESDGDLVVQTADERFTYTYREWIGKPWPAALHWESLKEPKTVVDFKFDDPEASTRSPKKWEAKSQQGEVRIRWRDRNAKTSK
jgi:hypothetical protein